MIWAHKLVNTSAGWVGGSEEFRDQSAREVWEAKRRITAPLRYKTPRYFGAFRGPITCARFAPQRDRYCDVVQEGLRRGGLRDNSVEMEKTNLGENPKAVKAR